MRSVAEVNVCALVEKALVKAAPDGSVIIPTPSLQHAGVVDRLWRSATTSARKLSLPWSMFRRILTSAKFLTGDYSQNWQPIARAVAVEVSRRTAIDCCIGEHSPDAGLFLARWFSKEYGVPWIADFRDPALRNYRGLPWQALRALLKWQLRTASMLVNVTPRWTQTDQQDFGRPCHCIPNGFDPDEFATRTGTSENGALTITYAGNIHGGTIDPFRGIRLFLCGLAQVGRENSTDVEPAILFKYVGGMHAAVADLAHDCGASDRVIASPGIARDDAIHQLLMSDLLLLISIGQPKEESRYYRHGFYPGKVFEYFGVGAPICCVPGDNGQLDELLATTGTGTVLKDAKQVRDFLERQLALKRAGKTLPHSPRKEVVARYTRANLAGKLAFCLDGCTVMGSA